MKTTCNLLFMLCTLLLVGEVKGQEVSDVVDITATIEAASSECYIGGPGSTVGSGTDANDLAFGTIKRPPGDSAPNAASPASGTVTIDVSGDHSQSGVGDFVDARGVISDETDQGFPTIEVGGTSLASITVSLDPTPPTYLNQSTVSTDENKRLGFLHNWAQASANAGDTNFSSISSTSFPVPSGSIGTDYVGQHFFRIGGTVTVQSNDEAEEYSNTITIKAVCSAT